MRRDDAVGQVIDQVTADYLVLSARVKLIGVALERGDTVLVKAHVEELKIDADKLIERLREPMGG